jgi:cell division protein FtsI (penicillin-binding protein 3)/stage V sporulation protein D (sporulation-specific penicillin-binding protein)
MGFRFSILIIIITVGASLLLFNFYQIQIVKGSYYLARAETQFAAGGFFDAQRGAIYGTDKNGNPIPLVINKDYPLIFAVPKEIADIQEVANQLAPLINQPVSQLEKILSKSNDSYELLERKADPNVAQQISDLNLKGIYSTYESDRFYPFASVASQVLGFVGYDSQSVGESGRYGVEKFYNSSLSGQSGSLNGNKVVSPQQGEDLTLTIDPNIENEAEMVLKNLVSQYKATGGEVIINDPQSGKILAMGSVPNFDPNNYSSSEIGNFLNPVVSKIYEPGSIFKPITMAIGIDAGKITPDTTYVDNGHLVVDGHVIKNWDLKAHGKVTMTTVIEDSLNTGAAFAEKQTGNQLFRQGVLNFGFDKITGIDLPGEVAGDVRQLKDNAPQIVYSTASFGQGIAVTPIEMVAAMSAIANGGKLMRPYVNAALQPETISQPISASAASQVTQMMVAAIDNARVADLSGYSLAGKTGTAQIPDHIHGGYYSDKYIDTYIGFGPASNPKFLIFIKIDDPFGNPFAAETVVPAFKELAQFMINYYNIPPDRING